MNLNYIILNNKYKNLLPPKQMSLGASGYDLIAAVDNVVVLEPGKTTLIPNGFSLSMPKGVEAQIRPRSGLALNHQVTVLNSPGTIDSDYTGEIKTLLINHGNVPYKILPGARVSQMIFATLIEINFKTSQDLLNTKRGAQGFGSTGT